MGDPAGVGPEVLARTLAASAAISGVLQQSELSGLIGTVGFGKAQPVSGSPYRL